MTYRTVSFSGGRYWHDQTFTTLADALSRSVELGHKSKVQVWRNGKWANVRTSAV